MAFGLLYVAGMHRRWTIERAHASTVDLLVWRRRDAHEECVTHVKRWHVSRGAYVVLLLAQACTM